LARTCCGRGHFGMTLESPFDVCLKQILNTLETHDPAALRSKLQTLATAHIAETECLHSELNFLRHENVVLRIGATEKHSAADIGMGPTSMDSRPSLAFGTRVAPVVPTVDDMRCSAHVQSATAKPETSVTNHNLDAYAGPLQTKGIHDTTVVPNCDTQNLLELHTYEGNQDNRDLLHESLNDKLPVETEVTAGCDIDVYPPNNLKSLRGRSSSPRQMSPESSGSPPHSVSSTDGPDQCSSHEQYVVPISQATPTKKAPPTICTVQQPATDWPDASSSHEHHFSPISSPAAQCKMQPVSSSAPCLMDPVAPPIQGKSKPPPPPMPGSQACKTSSPAADFEFRNSVCSVSLDGFSGSLSGPPPKMKPTPYYPLQNSGPPIKVKPPPPSLPSCTT